MMRTLAIAAVFTMVICDSAFGAAFKVTPTGSDSLDGLSWPTAKATPGAALAIAASGDQVWVAAGTYHNVNATVPSGVSLLGGFAGNEAAASGRNPTANVTVLDGGGSGSVVMLSSGGGQLVDGFTLRDGAYGVNAGVVATVSNNTIENNSTAGIWESGGGLTIGDNTIETNGSAYVGGVYVENATDLVLSGNTISGNTGGATTGCGGVMISTANGITFTDNVVDSNQMGFVGGVYLLNCTGITFRHDVVSNNTAEIDTSTNSYGGLLLTGCTGTVIDSTFSGNHGIRPGGGMRVDTNSVVDILYNTFTNNLADAGGGLRVVNSTARIVGNLIYGNQTFSLIGTIGGQEGGGLLVSNTQGIVANNTICNNSAPSGGGVAVERATSPLFVNNIVAFNTTGFFAQLDGNPVLAHNCVYNPGGAEYDSVTPGTGDISTDPLFADTAFNLSANSPCIDSGDNGPLSTTLGDLALTDYYGSPRIYNGIVDIGAAEYSTKSATQLTIANAHAGAGQRITLSATLSRAGDSKPLASRQVTFKVDGAVVGTASTTSGGTATLPWTSPVAIGIGAHGLAAEFAGDAYDTAGSASGTLTVVKGTPVFSLYAASGTAGQSLSLKTLVVYGGLPILGRTVQFAVDGTAAGSAVSDASGAALTWIIPASMPVGLHNVTVSFAGDASYNPATRTTAALTVVAPKVNVIFSQYPATGAPGAKVTLKTLVYSGGKPVSGLAVKFRVDGFAAGSAVSDASGAAVFYTIPASMAVGAHDVTVSFAGDSAHNAATRTTPVLTVTIPKANVLFSIYDVGGAPGAPVTLKTLVYSGGKPAIGLNVQFSVDGTAAGSAVSDASGASRSYTIPASMAVGVHDVTVSFAGDASHNAATRTSPELTVSAPKANVTFSLYDVYGIVGATVPLRTLVYSGGIAAVGLTVQFSVDGSPVGSTVSDANGAALPYTIPPALATGAHNVTVTFAGDATHNSASRTTAALTVK